LGFGERNPNKQNENPASSQDFYFGASVCTEASLAQDVQTNIQDNWVSFKVVASTANEYPLAKDRISFCLPFQRIASTASVATLVKFDLIFWGNSQTLFVHFFAFIIRNK